MNYIIFNHDGSIKNVNFAEIIVQGNNLVDEIFVAVEGRSTDSYLATAYFELPNGESNFLTATLASRSIDQSAYNGYKFLLTGAQTALYGRVRMSLKLEGVQGETLWTYEQVLTINKSGYNPDFTMITMSQYAALVQAMGSLQEKFVVNNARFYSSLANAQADLDNLAFNQCVIIADVTATDPIPEIYFKNAESQLELLAGIGEYTFQAGTTTTQTLAPGSDATVSVSFVASGKTITMNFTFGIPRGNTGATGNGISSIAKISTEGQVDTYRISFTNGSHFDYTVTNGTLAGKLAVATFVYDSSSAVNFTQQLAKFIIGLVGNDLDRVKSITRFYTVPSAYQEYRGETVLFDIFRYMDYNSKFYLPDGTQITTSTDAYQFSVLYEVDGITVADIGYFELSSSDTSGYLDDDQAQEARKTVCLIKRGNDIFHFAQEYEGTKYFKTIPLMRVTGYKQGSIEINGLDSNSPTWEYESEDYDMDSAPTQNSTNLVTSGGVHSAVSALDSKISKNAEDIATLTEALIKKDLYETQEATFLGMTAVPAGAMVKAYLDGFKGNSAVVNQLVQNGNFENVSAWIAVNCTYSVSGNVATITPTAIHSAFQQYLGTSVIANNHKYLAVIDIKYTSGETYTLNIGNVAEERTGTGSWEHIEKVITPTNTNGYFNIFDYDDNIRSPYQVRNAMLIDIGINGITSTVSSEVKELLKHKDMDVDSYIPYNAGTLTDCKERKLISNPYNLYNEEYLVGYYDGSTGAYVSASGQLCSKNYIKVFGGQSYTCDLGNNSTYWRVCWYDKNHGFISSTAQSGGASVQAPSNAWFAQFGFGSVYGGTYHNDVCFHLASANLGYKPHRDPIEYTLTLPTLKSAGSVQDESKAGGEKIGKDDLGDLGWIKNATYHVFYGALSMESIKRTTNLLFDDTKYSIATSYYTNVPDNSYGMIADNAYQFAVVDASLDDVSPQSFRTLKSGKKINYELATPTDFSDPISYPEIFNVEAGGSVEVVGDGCDATTKVYFYVEA